MLEAPNVAHSANAAPCVTLVDQRLCSRHLPGPASHSLQFELDGLVIGGNCALIVECKTTLSSAAGEQLLTVFDKIK